jgi:hypothetical protein
MGIMLDSKRMSKSAKNWIEKAARVGIVKGFFMPIPT